MSKKKRTQINSAYDILEQVEKIKGKIENVSYNEFKKDDDIQTIIEHKLMIIAEALTNIDLDNLLLVNNDRIYWRLIKDMRNKMVHEYWGIDIKTVYEVAKEEMEELEGYIRNLISNLKEWWMTGLEKYMWNRKATSQGSLFIVIFLPLFVLRS